MDKTRIVELYEKYLKRELSVEEVSEWERTVLDPDSEDIIFEEMDRHWKPLSGDQGLGKDWEKRTIALIAQYPQYRKKRNVANKYIAAAVLLFILGTSLLLFKKNSDHVVSPGGNKAVLTFADGTSIDLKENQDGISIEEQGIHYFDGSIIQQTSENINKGNLKITTPKGGQYHLKLSDGTIVFLDAYSSLEYPASFKEKLDRRVKLKGRAYFEVAKDKMKSFVVSSGNQEVVVLGTHFVVDNYKDDKVIKTTLIEGKVNVLTRNGFVKKLKPGQQSILTGNELEVRNVDVENITSWKDGMLSFNDLKLEEIMEEVSRWYDVDVFYNDKELKNEVFYGIMPRFEKLTNLLMALEKTSKVHFIIEGRKVIIEKKH